jgi:hypothetical protein
MLMRLLLLAMLLAGGPALASNTATGSVWLTPGGGVPRALPENIPAGTADVTFRAPASPLVLHPGIRLADVLADAGADNIAERRAGALDAEGGGRFYVFTGRVTVRRGQTFTALHSDNLTLIIGGIPVMTVDGQGSAAVTATTYGGPAGTQPFTLILSQCCDGTSAFSVDLPLRLLTMIPLPPGAALFGVGFGALLLVRRRPA